MFRSRSWFSTGEQWAGMYLLGRMLAWLTQGACTCYANSHGGYHRFDCPERPRDPESIDIHTKRAR